MSLKIYREANWRTWAVKGRLCPINWKESALWSVYHDYGMRMWMNEEATYTAKDGFREAFMQRIQENLILHSYVNMSDTPMARWFMSLENN
jgi:hypothetical protein